MSTVIRLPERLYKRLEKYATGFDTPVQVIEKLLNQIEGVEESSSVETDDDTDLLTIKLNPPNTEAFREKLLQKRRAEIAIYYADGRTELKPWNARRFGPESDVIGNLRSRKEFRRGVWQNLGIKYIAVSV